MDISGGQLKEDPPWSWPSPRQAWLSLSEATIGSPLGSLGASPWSADDSPLN